MEREISFLREERSEKTASIETVSDIFAQVWGEEEARKEEDSIPLQQETLEQQLQKVEQTRESYAAFHGAVSALGSGLLQFFTTCGVACVGHAHGLLGVAGSSPLSGVSFLGGHVGDVHDHHDHTHEEKHTPVREVVEVVPKAQKEKTRSLPVSSRGPKKYINVSDLAAYLLLPASGM